MLQPGSWASALKKNLKSQSSAKQRTQDTANADLGSTQDAILCVSSNFGKSAQPTGAEPNSKAAARQKLLTEALKSRANAVTGERHCLGCGRSFYDLSRFAQHILDKHGGINSSEPVTPYYQNITNGGNGGGMDTDGAHSAFPSLVSNEIKLFKLGDVAVVRTHAATSKPLEPPNRKVHRTATTAAGTANAGTSSQRRRKPDPTAFQAPEGTHAKRKKRPSRLKRIYRRTKAEAAVQHWLSVLSAIEEALQIVGELHGAITNEMQALQQREEERFSADPAQEENNRRNVSFAQALREGSSAKELHSNGGGGVFAPSVQLQLLQEQVRLTCERVEQLGSIHATARANLVKSQEQLLTAQGGRGGGKASLLRIRTSEATKETPDAIATVNTDGAVETTLAESPLQRGRALHSGNALRPPPPSPVPSSNGVEKLKQPVVKSTATSIQESLDNGSSASTSSSRTSSSSSSTSSSSSGSDFGLQWGDTLRTWATNVGVDACTSLQQQQRQQTQEKQHEGVREELARKKVVVERAIIKTEVNIVSSKLIKVDDEVAVPLPATAIATTTTTASATRLADTTPLPTATDAVCSWLEGTETADTTLIETLSPSCSITSLDQINLDETQAAPGLALPLSLAITPSIPASASPPFHCDVCNITASGLKPWQDHLSSRRHASKVAQQAAHNTSQQQQQKQQPDFSVKSTAPNLPSNNKCYIGPNADVEPYVTHIITPELNVATTALLKQLLEWQERTRRLDPVNFKRKRRLVSGMREVEKSVKMSKAKLLIVAPNIGPVPTTTTTESDATSHDKNNDPLSPLFHPTVLTYPIQAALDMAKERKIPIVFALTRQRMGKILGARKTASAFVVLDASGAEQLLTKVLEISASANGIGGGSAAT